MEHLTLNNGNKIPSIGLGTYRNTNALEITNAIKTAYNIGFRLIDTAVIYENEKFIGNSIKDLKIDRKELFITSKVWNSEQGYESTLKSFELSLKNLQTDYLDMYLIHWPVAEKFNDTWRAFEHLYKQGVVKNIGVSNFHVNHLNELLKTANVIPAVNQIELHPFLIQEELQKFCKQKNIQIESWSPIAKARVVDNKELLKIAYSHGKTNVQITLRWHIQQGLVAIPKSVNPKHIEEFAEVFDFELSEEEMKKISTLNKNLRVGPDPDNFSF